MKHSIHFVLPILVFAFARPCAAQLEKGNFLLGGSLDFSSGKTKAVYSDPSQMPYNSNRNFAIDFAPNISYFITRQFTAGLIAPYHYSRSGGSSYHSTTISIGPVIRYYFPFAKWAVFPELSYRIGTSTLRGSDYKNVANINTYTAGAGITYFLNTHVGIEGVLNYQKYNRQDDSSKSNSSYLNFNIGLQVYLNKKRIE